MGGSANFAGALIHMAQLQPVSLLEWEHHTYRVAAFSHHAHAGHVYIGRSRVISLASFPLHLSALQLREGLLREAGDPRVLALDQARGVFSEEEARRLARAQMEAMLKQLEFIADMQGGGAQGGPGGADGAGPQSAGSAAQAAGVGPIRVSCWRKVGAVPGQLLWR
jgi:hypothetical protein